MAWIIGIDEAGYGPNLGPFVMSAVAFRVPDDVAHTDLWTLLAKAVERCSAEGDPRLSVDDSKKVYSPGKGIEELERCVLASLAGSLLQDEFTLHGWLDDLAAGAWPGDARLPWYTADRALPIVAARARLEESANLFQTCCQENNVGLAKVHTFILEPEPFNRTLDRWGTKGAALAQGLQVLLPLIVDAAEPMQAVHFLIDKHGGRNTYSAMLQHTFPEALVVARRESMECSLYEVRGGSCPISLRFQPRADGEHFCVALASMLSKYLREVLMQDLNRFWQERLPGLKPTAGYASDAPRFYEAIRPTAEKMGLAADVLWRRK